MAVRGKVARRSLHRISRRNRASCHLHFEEASRNPTDLSGGESLRFLLAFSSSLGQFLFCQLS